jgi:hypothetical protein
MPTILPSIQCYVAPAYSPIVWRIREYTISGVLPPVMRVKFFLDGAATPVYDMQVTHIETGTSGPPTYFFEVNAQEIFAGVIDNRETLLPDGESFAMLPIHQVHITVTPLLDSGGGYLVEDPAQTITSQPAGIVNAYRFSQEELCLDGYATPIVIFGEPRRPWLTRRPLHEEVCREHPFYLTGLTQTALRYRFATYDADGVLIATDDWRPDTDTVEKVIVLDASPSGIAALDVTGWGVDGVVIGDNVHRYTVQTVNKGGALAHQIFNLYPTRGCCEYQIVFLNSFGAYECMGIAYEDVMNYAVSGQTYKSARLLPSEAGYMLSRGDGYLFKEGRNVFQFSLPQSRDAYQDFYRDMMNSSDVYLRFGGVMVPVTINANTTNLRSNFGVVVTLTWSNTDRSQGN